MSTDGQTDRQTNLVIEAPPQSLKTTPNVCQNQKLKLKETLKIKSVQQYEQFLNLTLAAKNRQLGPKRPKFGFG